MSAVGKVTVTKSGDDLIVSDESGRSYTFKGRGDRPTLEIDARIDLTKPIYEQVQRLAKKDEARRAATAAKGKTCSQSCMTDGLLLDSHLLLWLDRGLSILPTALLEIGAARDARRLFVSDISVWELGVAYHTKSFERKPDLRGLTIDAWFKQIIVALDLRTVRLTQRIALEAASVPIVYGSGDPGDCFLIATARVQRLALVTRDAKMIELARRRPNYLTVIAC